MQIIDFNNVTVNNANASCNEKIITLKLFQQKRQKYQLNNKKDIKENNKKHHWEINKSQKLKFDELELIVSWGKWHGTNEYGATKAKNFRRAPFTVLKIHIWL